MKTKATTADAYNLIHEGALALARAERQGIRIDTEYCDKMYQSLSRRIERYTQKLKETKFYRRWKNIYGGKTNISSNHQLARLLYKNMKLEPVKTTEKGKESTDEESLKRLGLPELDLLLRIRRLNKVRDTYLKAFAREQINGYIHPSFNLHLVKTYRSSSSGPNFQNIPKRDKESMKICRQALLPRPGHMLLEADFSALEVNISQCYHKDPTMKKYLQDKNSDMHLDMAKQIFIMKDINKKDHGLLRQAAKNGFVFPQFYGDYYKNNAFGICDWVQLPHTRWKKGMGINLPEGNYISNHFIAQGIKSFDQFVNHMRKVEDDFWNRRFKVYNQWKNSWVDKYRTKGYLQMLTGFVCSGVMRKNEIINYPIQGAAFHCLLKTFIELDKEMRKQNWKSKLVGQIHDSIVMDVHPNELERVKETANYIVSHVLPKAWPWIIVKLEIDIDEYGVDQPWI